MTVSRRSFVNWLSRIAAAAGLAPRLPAQAPGAPAAEASSAQGATLDLALLHRLAEAVLPSELGSDGAARVARGFRDWIAAYRSGTELVHPYGSATIRYTGESPVTRWREQLATLDRQARAAHGRPFSSLSAGDRRTVVRSVLAEDRTARLPDPLSADHVAIALMAWWFRTPEATDLCYQARIGRHQCRPLVNSPREPVPLTRNRSGP